MNVISMNKRQKTLCAVYLTFQLLVLPLILTLGNTMLKRPLSEAWLNFAFFCINFLAVWAICHRYLFKSAKALFSRPWRQLLTVVFALIANHFAGIALSALLLYLMPDFFNVNDSTITYMAGTEFTLTLIGTVFLVPVAEEVLFRGLMFGSLYNRSPVIAYLVSVTAFCMIHVLGYIGLYPISHLLLCLLQYVPAAVILAWAYARTGTIFTPILIHAIINATGIFAMR